MKMLASPKGVPAILTGRFGQYDPDGSLSSAEHAGVWSAWKRTATSMSPGAVIRLMAEAGLRGRGGAGFPTADKWRAAAQADADRRYVVANGFEADPGAMVDRTLMENDPHAVVEGVAITAFAVGASHAYIAVRANLATALRRLTGAVRLAEEQGYIGSNALGAGFDLHVEVVAISGSMVVGEETVLLHAIENKRAQPDQRPPYPTGRGLWDRPTVVNNVATLAAVPWIMANGAPAFSGVGDDHYPGTALVQFAGAFKQAGIAEVPLGMSVRRLIDIADPLPKLKAVLLGGPAGGFLPPSELDTLYTPESLVAKGAMVGSGTVLAVGPETCLVEMATTLERFLSDEACGKSIPCRIGLRRLYEIGARATTGLARPDDAKNLVDLGNDVRAAALCGLEYCAPNPFLTGMRYFAAEFDDHFSRGTCPAGVCNPVRVAAGAMA
jgi:NADH:ubiquinone oxidoreductase subunit F (NADH-binding)